MMLIGQAVEWPSGLGQGGPPLVLGLLLASHCIGDFVLKSDAMEERREQARVALTHLASLACLHTLFLLPVLKPAMAFGVGAGLGVIHGLIDELELRFARRLERFSAWSIGQVAHLAALLAALVWVTWEPTSHLRGELTWGAWLVAGYAFNVGGGSAIVLGMTTLPGTEDHGIDHEQLLARRIGVLERFIVVTLALMEEWTAIGFVLAVKSVSRAKRLEADEPFAQRFLIGTLTSTAVAGATALVLTRVLPIVL